MHEILIVDDEPDIRMLVDGVLRDEGYDTRQARAAAAALAALPGGPVWRARGGGLGPPAGGAGRRW